MTGLDYNVLYQDLNRMDISASDYDDWKDDILTMEGAALAVVHEKKD